MNITDAELDPTMWGVFVYITKDEITSIALPASLYGILTILSIMSFAALIRRTPSGRGINLYTVMLSLTLLALHISTTIYLVFQILVTQADVLSMAKNSIDMIWNFPSNVTVEPPPSSLSMQSIYLHCGCTAALTVNILLGDAIVCWRACMIWPGNWTMRAVCAALLMASFAFGIVDTNQSCTNTSVWQGTVSGVPSLGTGSMFQGSTYGVVASVLSFSTNLCATLAVSYKAWETRRFSRKYFISGPMSTKTERLLSILIESGAIYCALWIVVVVWQIGMDTPKTALNYGTGSFWDVFGVFISGGLAPVIAIYPTIIIILIALDKSHMEKGFTKPLICSFGTMPGMHSVSVNVDTIVTTYHDCNRSERSMNHDVGPDGSSTHSLDKPKGDIVV